MKKFMFKLIVAALAISALGGCNFLMGPDEPLRKRGNLVISFGESADQITDRSITSAQDLSEAVFAALIYQVTLTGPDGEPPIEREIPHGKNLELTVALGVWQLDVRAYKEDGLAGTAILHITVAPGLNSLSVPMSLNEGYFDIALGPMDNGTVLPNFNAAFPDATITLTVTPDTGYVLKAGSLKVNDGAVPVAGSGSTYTFAMPAANATVSAVFNKLVGPFTIEGPQDKAITVTAAHSAGAGHTPATEISFAQNESITFTLNSPDYAAEDGNLQWLVNDVNKTGTTNSLTVNAREYTLRTYTLTVLIREGGQWYSTEAAFEVVP
jgi:hypothetical protein